MKFASMKWKKFAPLYLLMIPGLIYLLVNNYLPMFGIIIAFKDFIPHKGIFGSEWVGFDNFEYLFKTSDAYIITRNTILYNVSFILINTVAAIAVAILLNEIRKKFFQRFYQSIVIFPHLISMIIVSYLVFAMFSSDTGFINKSILPLFGIDDISWYAEKQYWPYILTIVNFWKGVGYLSVVYLASIISIDPEYYEAATLDGATRWQQIRFVTVPLIIPVITMMTLLAIGRIFYSDFGLFYQVPMNSGVLSETTNVIDTYVYRALMNLGDFGMSSAAGVYQSLVGFLLVIFSNYVVRKYSKDNALF
ncbi:ABC transporter permease [Paenibacillus sp. YIM B09110]|uniref:ABC transporter permease n=1 Tax=Paenibacillus sp. YIM B09110 TaxID=3126102 RepID=UPI00301CD5D7